MIKLRPKGGVAVRPPSGQPGMDTGIAQIIPVNITDRRMIVITAERKVAGLLPAAAARLLSDFKGKIDAICPTNGPIEPGSATMRSRHFKRADLHVKGGDGTISYISAPVCLAAGIKSVRVGAGQRALHPANGEGEKHAVKGR